MKKHCIWCWDLTNNWYWAKFAPHLTAFQIISFDVMNIYICPCQSPLLFVWQSSYTCDSYSIWSTCEQKDTHFYSLDFIEWKEEHKKIVNIVGFWNASSNSQYIKLFDCSAMQIAQGHKNYIDSFSCILLKQTTKIISTFD